MLRQDALGTALVHLADHPPPSEPDPSAARHSDAAEVRRQILEPFDDPGVAQQPGRERGDCRGRAQERSQRLGAGDRGAVEPVRRGRLGIRGAAHGGARE